MTEGGNNQDEAPAIEAEPTAEIVTDDPSKVGAGPRRPPWRKLWGALDFPRRWLGERWREVPSDRRADFTRNVAIGLAIELALVVFRGAPVLVGVENIASDLAMRIEVAVAGVERPPIPVGFVNIDEETWRDRRWGGGEPYYAPRNRLAELVRFAAAQKPRFVVLDVFVENPATSDDEAFVKGIEGLDARIDYILIRSLRPALPVEQEGSAGLLTAKIQPSRLDDFVRTHPNFHIAAPYFQTSRDGLVRSWRLWTVGCRVSDEASERGRLEVLPSVQLVVAALNRPGDPVRARRVLATAMKTEGACASGPAGLAGEGDLRRDAETAQERIGAQIADAGLVPGLKGRGVEDGGRSRILYRYPSSGAFASTPTVSAGSVLDGAPASPAWNKQAFQKVTRGGVIIIGQSSDASGDIHPTPLGAEPGSMIVLNAIASALNPGVIGEPSPLFEKGFIFWNIVIVGWVFACADSIVANAAAVVVVFGLLAPLSFLLLQAGYWLDFALPLAGIAIHRAIKELEEKIGHRLFGQGPHNGLHEQPAELHLHPDA